MVLCALTSIASNVGAPRVLAAKGIPYPAGDPALTPEAEAQWRDELLERAVRLLCEYPETTGQQP